LLALRYFLVEKLLEAVIVELAEQNKNSATHVRFAKEKLLSPADLYPHTLQEWIALVGVLTPFLGLAMGGVWRAWTYHREQKQAEWERLHELLKMLHNQDQSYGEWAQLAAVCELRSVRINSAILAVIVTNVLEHWIQEKVSPQLICELTNLQNKLRLRNAWTRWLFRASPDQSAPLSTTHDG
jgi:hypothetical protein